MNNTPNLPGLRTIVRSEVAQRQRAEAARNRARQANAAKAMRRMAEPKPTAEPVKVLPYGYGSDVVTALPTPVNVVHVITRVNV